MEDRLAIKNKPQEINAMLSNLSELQTFTLFKEFSKRYISNIGEVLLQKFMETLNSSSHSSLY